MIEKFLKLKRETTKIILFNALYMILILLSSTLILSYAIIHKSIPVIVLGSISSVLGLSIIGLLAYMCISLKMDYDYEKARIIKIIDDIFIKGGYYEED